MSDTTKDTGTALARQRTFSLMPSSLGEAREIAILIANSDFAPKDYKGKPDNVLIAIQMGGDLGLKPMQALQNIAVINGRPSIWGDAALALSMEVLERFHEEFVGIWPQDTFTAVCTSKRKGWPDETVTTFSIGDAKTAGLWTKAGTWQQYPKRMLRWRACGFNLRITAADRLLGLILAEEAMDYPTIEGTVVSETAGNPTPLWQDLIAAVPDALRDNIGKAYAELKMSTPNPDGSGWTPTGLGLSKINEFLGGDGVDPEAGAIGLLTWCRDEYAKRRTGAPAKRKDGNGKQTKDPTPATPAGETPSPTGAGQSHAGPSQSPDQHVGGADRSSNKTSQSGGTVASPAQPGTPVAREATPDEADRQDPSPVAQEPVGSKRAEMYRGDATDDDALF